MTLDGGGADPSHQNTIVIATFDPRATDLPGRRLGI